MAQLSGSTSNISTTIADINALGFVDWLKVSAGGVITKSGGGSTITASLGGFEVSSSPIGRTIGWAGGTPTASGSDDGAQFNGVADTITLPASTAVRTAVLYLGTSDLGAGVVQFTINASLSDGSAAPYAFTTTGANACWNITLIYASASASQTLNITITPTTSWAFTSAIGYSVAAGLTAWVDQGQQPPRPRRNVAAFVAPVLPSFVAGEVASDAQRRPARRRAVVDYQVPLPAPLAIPVLLYAPEMPQPPPLRPRLRLDGSAQALPAPLAAPSLTSLAPATVDAVRAPRGRREQPQQPVTPGGVPALPFFADLAAKARRVVVAFRDAVFPAPPAVPFVAPNCEPNLLVIDEVVLLLELDDVELAMSVDEVAELMVVDDADLEMAIDEVTLFLDDSC